MARDKRIDLTEAYVKSLQVDPTKDTYYNDAVQEGLVLIVRKGGRKVYVLRTRDRQGTQIKRTIGNANQISLKAARTAAKQWCSQLVQGQNPFVNNKSDNSKTFAEIFNKWEEWAETHPSDPSAQRRNLKGWRFGALGYFEKMQLDKISLTNIEEFYALKAKEGRKTSTINRYVTELKFIARWAVEHQLIETHQLKSISRRPELDSEPKKHHLTPEQRSAFLAVVEAKSKQKIGKRNMSYVWPLTYLLMHTGVRPATALGLIWSDINLEKETMYIRASNIKTRQSETKRLSPKTVAELKKWKLKTTGKASDPLFPGDGTFIKSVKKLYKGMFTDIGLPQYSAYSLRHDYASELARKGATTLQIQIALCHKSPKMSLKYVSEIGDLEKQIADMSD